MAKELLAIQYLRGIAALMVVVVHIPVQLSRMGFNGDWPEFLNIGVDIFFVISGFIMWTTTFDGRVGVAQFLSRRLVRIAPLYWALTSITVLVMLAAPTLVQSGKLDLQHVITSYLFVASQHPVTQLMEPILVPGWTLNYEMFFYVVFALCLPLRAGFRAMAVMAILVTLVALQVFVPDRKSTRLNSSHRH